MVVEAKDRALATIDGEFKVVAPLVSVEEAKAQWQTYQKLAGALLDASDYQTYRDRGEEKRFKKKSAWRKFATFYGFKVEISDVRIGHKHNAETCARVLIPGESECGCPTQYARVLARVTAPNGRFSDGIGVCSIGEKNRVFTKPDHEIPATAHTRAANRAIADLMGVGEDSAEEVRGTEGVKGLPQEDRDAIKLAWSLASQEQRDRAIAQMREWGFQGQNVAGVFTDFSLRAGEDAVAQLLSLLAESGERFDPDAVTS